MRLPRPYTPYRIRIEVAKRMYKQRYGAWTDAVFNRCLTQKACLDSVLLAIFGGVKVQLHHRPALCNRRRWGSDYSPRANNPDYLVYLPIGDHDIETRIRGKHGQHSDLGLRRKLKRMHAKRVPRGTKGIWGTTRKRPRRRLRGRGFDKTRRRKVSGEVVPRQP